MEIDVRGAAAAIVEQVAVAAGEGERAAHADGRGERDLRTPPEILLELAPVGPPGRRG
jgi:hypothetical protein